MSWWAWYLLGVLTPFILSGLVVGYVVCTDPDVTPYYLEEDDWRTKP